MKGGKMKGGKMKGGKMKGGKMKIIKVTDENINGINNLIKKKNQKVVAKFTADWCGHCKDLNNRVMPGVEEIIRKQPGQGILLNVSDLMMPKLEGIDTRVNGFPTIRSFVGGKKKKDYDGKREVKDLANFVKKSLGKCRKNKKDNKATKNKKDKKSTKNKKDKKSNKTKKAKRVKKSNKTKKAKRAKRAKKDSRKTHDAMRERFFNMISLK